MAEDEADRPWLHRFSMYEVWGFCILAESKNPKIDVKNGNFKKLLVLLTANFGQLLFEQACQTLISNESSESCLSISAITLS